MSDVRNFKSIVLPDIGTPVDEGATVAKDTLGRALRLGDHVLMNPGVQIPFVVAAARRILDPRAPSGTEEIMLQAQFPFTVTPGRNVMIPCTRVMTAAEAGGSVVTVPSDDPGKES
jgi:hypothetical protein